MPLFGVTYDLGFAPFTALYGVTSFSSSNLFINLVDSITGNPVEADITVDIDGVSTVVNESSIGLEVDPGANISIHIAEATHFAKVVAPFVFSGVESITIELRKIYYYRVRAIKGAEISDWSSIAKLTE